MTIRWGHTPDGGTEVMIDESDSSILVNKLCGDRWITTLDWRAPNLRVLAEHFSDALGYGPVVALLHSWNVPHTNPLWILNHKGGLNHFTDH